MNRKQFIKELCEEFKLFCIDSLENGHDIEDHFEFMAVCFEVFIDTKESESGDL